MQRSTAIASTGGILLTTDVPTKQLIVFIDNENDNKIILKDLDDTHLIIKSDYLDYVQNECERLHEQNVFERK